MWIPFAAATAALAAASQEHEPDCARLQALVHEVYGFRPSQLTAEEQKQKGADMDRVWKLVETDPAKLAPCLRLELEKPAADAWFRVDGSSLLVKVDPSRASKELQARCWCAADLADVAPAVWVPTLAQLGAEGLDISEAGRRWLTAGFSYHVPEHALEVGQLNGALFLFGSLDETFATPTLVQIAGDASSAARELALFLLTLQSTADSLRALRDMDTSSFSAKARAKVAETIAGSHLLERKSPGSGLTHDKLVKALQAFVDGNSKSLFDIQLSRSGAGPRAGEDQETWPNQFVGLARPDDVELLRKVRRVRMTYQSDEALNDYYAYSNVLLALAWKKELFK